MVFIINAPAAEVHLHDLHSTVLVHTSCQNILLEFHSMMLVVAGKLVSSYLGSHEAWGNSGPVTWLPAGCPEERRC